MATLKQIEANRLNAQKSTGPRSVEGKGAVRMNALKSGIDAKSAIIRGENPADLEALTNEYLEAHSPATPQERFYVDILIRCDWHIRRLTRADAQLWEYRFQDYSHMPENCSLGKIYFYTDRVFARLQRHIKDLERSYKDAARELTLLQSARASEPDPAPPPQPIETKPTSSEIGFVPSAGVHEPELVPGECDNPPAPGDGSVTILHDRFQQERLNHPVIPSAISPRLRVSAVKQFGCFSAALADSPSTI